MWHNCTRTTKPTLPLSDSKGIAPMALSRSFQLPTQHFRGAFTGVRPERDLIFTLEDSTEWLIVGVLGGELPFQGGKKKTNEREMFDAENGETVKPTTNSNQLLLFTPLCFWWKLGCHSWKISTSQLRIRGWKKILRQNDEIGKRCQCFGGAVTSDKLFSSFTYINYISNGHWQCPFYSSPLCCCHTFRDAAGYVVSATVPWADIIPFLTCL